MNAELDLLMYAFKVRRLLNCLEHVDCNGTPARQAEYAQAVVEVLVETERHLTPIDPTINLEFTLEKP